MLYCRNRFTSDATAILTSSQGNWGVWSDLSSCADGMSRGYRLKVEAPIAGDNTAANGLEMVCIRAEGVITWWWLRPNLEGSWGSWGPLAQAVDNTAICGIQTRVEAPLGAQGDNTALNDVRFAFCTY